MRLERKIIKEAKRAKKTIKAKEGFLSFTTYIAMMSPLRAVVTMRKASLIFESLDCFWSERNLRPNLEEMPK